MNTRYDIYDGDEFVTHTHTAATAADYSERSYRVTAISGCVGCQPIE